MLWLTGFNGLSEDVLEAENVNIDYPDTLSLYLLVTIKGVKKARESRNIRAAKE